MSTVKNIFKALLVSSLLASTIMPAMASFVEQRQRYIAPIDYFLTLRKLFPRYFVEKREPVFVDSVYRCVNYTESSLGLLGTSNPVTGQPGTKEPGGAFLLWYNSCLATVVDKYFSEFGKDKPGEIDVNAFVHFFSPELLEALGYSETNEKDFFTKLTTNSWSSLDQDTQKAQIRYVLTSIIGPRAVIESFGFVKNYDDLVKNLLDIVNENEDKQIIQAVRTMTKNILLKEEFFLY